MPLDRYYFRRRRSGVKRILMYGAHIADYQELENVLHEAHKIRVESYILGPKTESELHDAARRGADIRVVLSEQCFGPQDDILEKRNSQAVDRLNAAGIPARLSRGPIHRKAVIADDVMFLDSRNLCGPQDLIVRTDSKREIVDASCAFTGLWKRAGARPARRADPAPAADAKLGSSARKDTVLAQELRAVGDPGRAPIDLSTETLGPCALTRFLEHAAKRHPVRIIASAHAYASSAPMRAEIAELTAAGASVRLAKTVDKFAVAAQHGWVGSANASPAADAMPEWGAVFGNGADRLLLARRFADKWAAAAPVAA